ncbi:MAG: hypothetical protein SGI98_11190 [Verrucomicrobiota bacterium]|nr:hypothetical protein [Verrucomicrobiota bacterium]
MEFDWRIECAVHPDISKQDVEESFEDPFGLKFLPEIQVYANQTRYFSLGQAGNGGLIFSVYRSNGKSVQIISSRLMMEHESLFYRRKTKQSLEGDGR